MNNKQLKCMSGGRVPLPGEGCWLEEGMTSKSEPLSTESSPSSAAGARSAPRPVPSAPFGLQMPLPPTEELVEHASPSSLACMSIMANGDDLFKVLYTRMHRIILQGKINLVHCRGVHNVRNHKAVAHFLL